MAEKTLTLIEHLEELRIHILRFCVVFLLCTAVTYAYRKELLDFIRKPVEKPLQKYTQQQATLKTNQQQQETKLLNGTNAYTCNCSAPQKTNRQTNKPIADSLAKPAKQKTPPVKQDWLAKTKTIAKTTLNKVKTTFNDFYTFFQHKAPDRVRQETIAIQNKEKQAVDRLNCVCTLKQANNTGSPMVYLGLAELFFAQMKVAIFAGLFFSLPYLLIEIWLFIAPALYFKEKKLFWIFVPSTYLFFISGAIFGYTIVFPFGFDFFLSLSQPGKIMPSLSIGNYLSFVTHLFLAFGFIFELPVFVFILARMGLLTPQTMLRNLRFALLIIAVASAVLTPPDPFTMLLMGIPLTLLYLISIVVCFFAQNKHKAALRKQNIDPDM